MTPERRRSRSGVVFCAGYHVEHRVYRRRICRREALEIRPAVHSARSSRKLKSSKGIKWSRWRGRSRRAFQNHSWVEIETDLYGLSGRSTDRGNDRGKAKARRRGYDSSGGSTFFAPFCHPESRIWRAFAILLPTTIDPSVCHNPRLVFYHVDWELGAFSLSY